MKFFVLVAMFLAMLPTAAASASGRALAQPTNCSVSVLALYTSAALAAQPTLPVDIVGAVDFTNNAFTNSQAGAQLHLLGSLPITWTEDPSNSFNIGSVGSTIDTTTSESQPKPTQIDLNRLASGSVEVVNGFTAPQLRDQYGADIVIVFARGYQPAGDAAAIGPNDDLAYAIVNVAGDWVFAHEVGHLLGARHDTDGNGLNYANSHIFSYWTKFKRNKVQTIMGQLGLRNTSFIQHFSNPSINYNSKPTGIAGQSDNARVIRDNHCFVADFRQAGSSAPLSMSLALDPGSSSAPCWQHPIPAVATVSGGVGGYQYSWSYSHNNSPYEIVPNSGGSSVEVPGIDQAPVSFLNSTEYVNVTVTVTDQSGASVTATQSILTDGTPGCA